MQFPGGPVVRTLISLPRAQVHSLVGELRSHEMHSSAKKKKKYQTIKHAQKITQEGDVIESNRGRTGCI